MIQGGGHLCYIVTSGSISLNNKPWLVRTNSVTARTRIAAFRDAVRKRDGRCVITGKVARGAESDDWDGFEAAHVFPLAYQGHWGGYDYDRWVTILAATGSSINSVSEWIAIQIGHTPAF